jgi:trans-2,3-dihydro-3-hydroxyanthranilate isomerase
MQVTFVTIDVFTDRQFGGNPLAVVLDAGGLSAGQMQQIATEFNLSETTFVLPPQNASHTARLRIFTPRAEIPFAGHPNIGTAFALAQEGTCLGRPLASDAMLFEEDAGLVRVELIRDSARITGARLAAPKGLSIEGTVPAEIVAEACAISAAGIETSHHQPCLAGCGIPFVLAEVKSREILAAAQPRVDVFIRHLPKEQVNGILLYVHSQDGDGFDIQARMFDPLHGIPEDPATGSANLALTGLLAQLRPEPDLQLALKIGQGFDMGRPSLLEGWAVKKEGAITEIVIGGGCVSMTRGAFALTQINLRLIGID